MLQVHVDQLIKFQLHHTMGQSRRLSREAHHILLIHNMTSNKLTSVTLDSLGLCMYAYTTCTMYIIYLCMY